MLAAPPVYPEEFICRYGDLRSHHPLTKVPDGCHEKGDKGAAYKRSGQRNLKE